jgi:hypothetical protein
MIRDRGSVILRVTRVLLGAAVFGSLCGQGCPNSGNVTSYDRFPERPELKLVAGLGASSDAPIEGKVSTAVQLTVYVQGGQPPYFVTFDFKDGSSAETTVVQIDPLQVAQPMGACVHSFPRTGQYVVTAGVTDAFERVAFTDIYVRVTSESDGGSGTGGTDLSSLTYCSIMLNAWGHFEETAIYDWQGPSPYKYEMGCGGHWFGSGSFTGNTFRAQWTARPDPGAGSITETGELRVTVDPVTLQVTSFFATRTQTDPREGTTADVTKSSVSGSGIPKIRYAPSSSLGSFLECGCDRAQVCTALGDSFKYRVDRAPSEWLTVVAYTELKDYDCDQTDPKATISIVFQSESE